MLVLICISYKNFPLGNGYHFVDKYFLISIGIGLVPLALISMPMWIGESLEKEIYLRLKFLGVSLSRFLCSEVFSYFILSFISISLDLIIATIFFSLKLPPLLTLITFIIQIFYCLTVLLLIGVFIGISIKKTKVIFPLGMLLLFFSYMICGVFIPFSELPSFIQNLGQLFPLKYVMNDFFSIWSTSHLFDVKFLLLNSVWLLLVLLSLYLFSIKKKFFNKNYNKGVNKNEEKISTHCD